MATAPTVGAMVSVTGAITGSRLSTTGATPVATAPTVGARVSVTGAITGSRLSTTGATPVATAPTLGAMVSVEFMQAGTRQPDPEFTKKVQAEALKNGLLLLSCGVYSNAIRFLFPLTIEDKLMDEALAILAKASRVKSPLRSAESASLAWRSNR